MRPFLLLAVLAAAPLVLWGKRVPPKPVKPVVRDGIAYSADGDGRSGYVLATESATGKALWRKKVYSVHIKFWEEEDVQWIYITDLKWDSDAILIRDEKARCYRLDLAKRRVKKETCP